ALDLAAQAEHGAGSLVGAISSSEGSLDLLAGELQRLGGEDPRPRGPAGGAARFASGLAPRHFRRQMAEVRVGEVGGETASKLAAAGAPIARAEGFEWHARSMEARAAMPDADSSA